MKVFKKDIFIATICKCVKIDYYSRGNKIVGNCIYGNTLDTDVLFIHTGKGNYLKLNDYLSKTPNIFIKHYTNTATKKGQFYLTQLRNYFENADENEMIDTKELLQLYQSEDLCL